MNKKEIWNFGEKIAAKFLLDNGYIFLNKNFYTRYWEIDLIFKKDHEYIFIEVKTRNNDFYWEWFESVWSKKINKILKVWEVYCFKNNINFDHCRFDVISILLNWNKKTCKIKHFTKVI